MRPGDREQILRWHRDLSGDVADASRRHYEIAPSATEARADGLWRLRVERKLRGFVLIAELDRRPVGYLMAHLAEFPQRHHLRTRGPNFEGFVSEAFVAKGARRHGIGSALFQEAEQRLMALGCDNVQLGVSAGNTAAREFYERLGYEEFGLRLRKDIAKPPHSWNRVRALRRRAGRKM